MTPRLLIVEDDAQLMSLLAELFGGTYIVSGVGTRAEALAALAADPGPDVVLLDINLPDGSGVDLIGISLAPVVVLTGKGSASVPGAAMTIEKPAMMATVSAALSLALRRA